MKRTFLAKRNALLSSANISWGALALGFAVLALFVRLLAPNFFLQAFAPAFSISNAIAEKSHAFFNSFSDVAALATRNERLTEENAALVSLNQTLLQKEASMSALGCRHPVSTSDVDTGCLQGIQADVVARPPESPYDTLVLSAGSDAGIVLGMEAFGAGAVPLGVVSLVTKDFSRVTLFSAPGAEAHGWVGKTNIPLSIFGAGAGAMQASLSRAANVAVGDTVFAPGPGMLPIGSIVRIDRDPSAPSINLRIMPMLNPFTLTMVIVRDTGASLSAAFFAATSTP